MAYKPIMEELEAYADTVGHILVNWALILGIVMSVAFWGLLGYWMFL